jgi:small basic protein (TIGR04137 family)
MNTLLCLRCQDRSEIDDLPQMALPRSGTASWKLAATGVSTYHDLFPEVHEVAMTIDKSLRRKNTLQRARNVLNRGERIARLQVEERWVDGRSPFNLPKVKVIKLVVKKAKKAKEEEKVEGAEGAAAPAAAGAAAPAAPAKGKEAAGGGKGKK